MKWLYIFVLFLIGSYANEYHVATDAKADGGKKIAIIGSGAGGSSAAYFLHEFLTQKGQRESVQIKIFEKNDIVGGRLKHIDVDGTNVELGGSIYYILNYFMRNFTLNHNFTELGMTDESDFGVWNGDRFVFQESDWKIVNIFNVLWRYGLSPMTVRELVNENLNRFMTIYDALLEKKKAFKTVEEMFDHMGLLSSIRTTTSKFLKENGISPLFVDELVAGITRINYGQSPNLHWLGGSISLIGSGDKVFKCKEGFSTVLSSVIKSSGAELLLKTSVQKISKQESGKYLLTFNRNSEEISEEFDVVILAAPLPFSEIEFTPKLRVDDDILKQEYQVTHVTIVKGVLNPGYFGLSSSSDLPQLVATTENSSLPFSSVSAKVPGNDSTSVYKVFSRVEMSENELKKLFQKQISTQKFKWNAYPILKPTEKLASFILSENLYYVNAIEAALSCIESEMIASKNIVNLIRENWK